ncbi:MAG: siroheme synthase [Acidisphaera sp.]|nr:siroheme synthase [Acidisphaera sp.]
MIPVALDPARLRLGLAGRGSAMTRRLAALREGGAQPIAVFCDAPTQAADAESVIARLPDAGDMDRLDLLWIVGLPDELATALAGTARARRVLVNVEDRPALCDFHSVAAIRRGDLMITVSTAGRSPGLAARIRESLARQFGPEWADRLEHVAELRRRWREEGRSMAENADLTEALVRSMGWLA